MKAEVGVFGGSGFYSFLDDPKVIDVAETPYGVPSGALHVGEIEGRQVAFMARHGDRHQIPPHMINHRANLWAMKDAGVQRILAPCAVGSMDPALLPGAIALPDQLIDRTGRTDTFFDGPETIHVSFADPYCGVLRATLRETAAAEDIAVTNEATMVVIPGPRFSTRAEAARDRAEGCSLANMTQIPEAPLAREAEICYAGIALVTNFDAGVGAPEEGHASAKGAVQVFTDYLPRLRRLLVAAIPRIPAERVCPCATALTDARA